MDYPAALHYLDSFLNLEKIPKPHSRIWNLRRMRELLRIFDHPEKGIFTVVIGGTKGKGSTGFFLSEILRQSGLSVGFYHSPHLESPLERIWIGGKPVSRQDFSRGLSSIQRKLGQMGKRGFTYFEILTLLACLLFKDQEVEIGIFEAGMGGRLDATHVLPAKLVILTSIHYDHEAYLGNTLSEITREKAALLVPCREAVVAPQLSEAAREIGKMARRRHVPIYPPSSMKGMAVGLLGNFQRLNAGLALRAAAILRDKHRFPITSEALTTGLASSHWPGRMELFRGQPLILLDGAHNPHSVATLCHNLKKLFPNRRKILIFGTSRDKRSDRMIPFLAEVVETCILTQSRTARAKEIELLLTEAYGKFREIIPTSSSRKAFTLAQQLAGPRDLIVVTGSFYLIGEIRPLCRK